MREGPVQGARPRTLTGTGPAETFEFRFWNQELITLTLLPEAGWSGGHPCPQPSPQAAGL